MSKKDFIFQNNLFIERKDAYISIDDRGFLFGDGLFETLRIINGKIFDFEAHFDRIKIGLSTLKIEYDFSKLEDIAKNLVKINEVQDGILKIIISRGNQSVGYLSLANNKPSILIQTLPLRNLPSKISIGISEIVAQKNISFKSLSSISYVLCKNIAFQENRFDDIIFSSNNFISQTSSANIFWVKDDIIYTPSKLCDIVLGTVRRRILEMNLGVIETESSIDSLEYSDEIFLTNSSNFIISIDELILKSKKEIIKKYNKTIAKKIFCLINSLS